MRARKVGGVKGKLEGIFYILRPSAPDANPLSFFPCFLLPMAHARPDTVPEASRLHADNADKDHNTPRQQRIQI